MTEGLKPKLFSEPIGPSRGLQWAKNTTPAELICEPCGKLHSEREVDDNLGTAWVLGYQVVIECCGRMVDTLYEQFGDDFTRRKLTDLSENPTGAEHTLLRAVTLPHILDRAKSNLEAASANVEGLVAAAGNLANV
jgi:hypothetical protein